MKPKKQMKSQLTKMQMGHYIKKDSDLVTFYGCKTCPYSNSPFCNYGGKHSNGICSTRALQIKNWYTSLGSSAAVMQKNEILRLRMVVDKLTASWAKDGKIPKQFHQISRNLNNLLAKFRIQEEGIKHKVELSKTTKEFLEITEKQYLIIQDAKKQHNGKRPWELEEEAEVAEKRDKKERKERVVVRST